MLPVTLDALRRYAVARTLFAPAGLARAIERLGFVQADPIRAPARAQDLILRHRVAGYRAGDLERRYPRLALEEDQFVNYGFLPRRHLALLHPRTPRRAWSAATAARATELLRFVRERGPTHPREANAALGHGRVRGNWGADLNATTHLLDDMHYRGLLRVVRREGGTRVFGAALPLEARDAGPPEDRARALLALIVAKYAPLPSASLTYLARLLDYGAPQLRPAIRAALGRLQRELPSAEISGQRWLWCAGESPTSKRLQARDSCVRLLAPFDPIVWDRRRFELLWGWSYRFEAYTPAAQRRFGYYALPLLWDDRVIGWANLRAQGGALRAELGYVAGRPPRDPVFGRELEAELDRIEGFLAVPAP